MGSPVKSSGEGKRRERGGGAAVGSFVLKTLPATAAVASAPFIFSPGAPSLPFHGGAGDGMRDIGWENVAAAMKRLYAFVPTTREHKTIAGPARRGTALCLPIFRHQS